MLENVSYLWYYIFFTHSGLFPVFLSHNSLGFSVQEIHNNIFQMNQTVFIYLNVNTIFNVRGWYSEFNNNENKKENSFLIKLLSNYFTHITTMQRVQWMRTNNSFFFNMLSQLSSYVSINYWNFFHQINIQHNLFQRKKYKLLSRLAHKKIICIINLSKINMSIIGKRIFYVE